MESPEHQPATTNRRNAGGTRRPLYIRMYFSEMMTELVRLIDYRDVPVAEAQMALKPLMDRYGRQAIMDACEELLDVETAKPPAVARLKTDVRKLAFQMLGPPPEDRPTVVTASGMKTDDQTTPKSTPKPSASTKKPRRQERPPTVPSHTARTTSPILQQYRAAKERHPGMILFFRIGESYEVFDQDAKTAATLLGLTLTRRDNTVEMASFPQHQLEPHLKKLLKEGHRVAICDEVEMPDPAWEHASDPDTGVATPGARSEQNGVPVNMPRYHVMAKFEEHLAATKVNFSTAAELRKGMPFLEMLPALDYVFVRGQMRLYVAVRPALRGSQAAQLIAIQDAVLANCAAVRIWPVEGPLGWEWKEHELFAGPLGIDPKRFKLSLDDWHAVHEHCAGDKNCGRDWLTGGCACACCRAARAILTFSATKRRAATKK